MSDLSNLVAAIALVVAAVFAIAISVGLRGRERRQAIASVHIDLTTGETASARDVIGSVLYGPGLAAVGAEAAISSYYKLHWAVQRTENAYRVFKLKPEKLDRDIEDFLSWNFREIVQNIVKFRQTYRDELEIADEQAWQTFVERVKYNYPKLARKVFAS
jgi:hypothetical protein